MSTGKILSTLLLPLLLAVPSRAEEVIINFEGIPSPQAVGTRYAAQGVSFAPAGNFVWPGVSNGNIGNWGLEGTNGAQFLGINQDYGFNLTIQFNLATSVSVDVSRSNGSGVGDTLTLSAYFDSTLVDSKTVTFGAINSWQTVLVTGSSINRVVLSSGGSSYRPYGVDNIHIVPEPATLALIGLGFGAVLIHRTWRRRY